MMIWKQSFNIPAIQQFSQNTLSDHLGIEYTEIGDDYIIAKMPVDHRTVQPFRILHGGASVALAETLGSVASFFCIEDNAQHTTVGVEINANHLKPVSGGYVYGKVSPLRIGRKIQVWNIDIRDEEGNLICVSRLTIMVVERK